MNVTDSFCIFLNHHSLPMKLCLFLQAKKVFFHLYRLYFIYLLETDKGVSRMRRDITQRVSSLIVTERYSEVWEQGEGGNGTLL